MKAIALPVVGLASLLPPLERAETADLILCSRTTITVDARDRVEEALAARNGVIHTVGSHRESKALGGPGCKLIDPQGRTAPPGLIDAHSLPFYPSVLGPAPPTPLACQFGTVIALVTGVSMVALLVPARRATRVDPMIALRAE